MPDWRSIVRQQLAALRIPAPIEAALVDELAEHLLLSYDERVAAGETPEQAAREVITAFNRDDALMLRLRALRRTQSGSTAASSAADGPRWGALLPDVKTVSRRLRRDWMVTLALIATLAVGIGTTAAIGAAAKLIVLDPLPFKKRGSPRQRVAAARRPRQLALSCPAWGRGRASSPAASHPDGLLPSRPPCRPDRRRPRHAGRLTPCNTEPSTAYIL